MFTSISISNNITSFPKKRAGLSAPKDQKPEDQRQKPRYLEKENLQIYWQCKKELKKSILQGTNENIQGNCTPSPWISVSREIFVSHSETMRLS